MAHGVSFFREGTLTNEAMTRCIYPWVEDLHTLLYPIFASTPHEWLFTGNFVDRVHSIDKEHIPWNPLNITKDGHSIYLTVCKILHTVNEILQTHELSAKTKYNLTLYQDMHIPLLNHMLHNPPDDDALLTDYGDGAPIKLQPDIKLFDTMLFHEGMLPDVLNHVVQCSFFSDAKSKANPIVHLISKALPQRCTIRNLREIISNYCRKHDDVYQFVIGCLKCSILGLYKTCTYRTSLEHRIHIIRAFNTMNKPMMLQFMMQDHQQLLFYVIKEFLIFAVRKIPSIYAEIKDRYNWDNFEHCVSSAMNKVRECKHFDPRDPLRFTGVEQMLIVMNKQQIHHLYRPTKHTLAKQIINECEKLDDLAHVKDCRTAVPHEYRELLYTMAIRHSGKMNFEWLEYFNVGKKTIRALNTVQNTYTDDGSKVSLKPLLQTLSRYEFEIIRDIAEAYDRKQNVRVFTLPAHIYIAQRDALQRKYETETIPDYAQEALVCLHCKTFKSFVTMFGCKITNLYAYGHSKILIDDETMQVYCGKRCDKVDGKKRHHYQAESAYLNDASENHTRYLKRCAKEERKDIRNKRCAQTPLTSIHLLGRVLQFYDTLYTICTSCANFMTLDFQHYHDGIFYCGTCMQHGKLYSTIACEWCKAVRGNETWDTITVLDENNANTTIYLCQSCHKPWIRNATVPLKLSVIKTGLLERWKRLQHPSNI